MNIKDKQLFEDQVTHLQTMHDLNPLAAKILVYMVWDFGWQGVTFDEIVEFFGASKSSVSTSIKILEGMNLIESITKIDSRKRYFRLNKEHSLEKRLQSVILKLEKEQDIAQRFLVHLEESEKVDSTRIKHFKIYSKHLHQTIQNIENCLQEMNEVEVQL